MCACTNVSFEGKQSFDLTNIFCRVHLIGELKQRRLRLVKPNNEKRGDWYYNPLYTNTHSLSLFIPLLCVVFDCCFFALCNVYSRVEKCKSRIGRKHSYDLIQVGSNVTLLILCLQYCCSITTKLPKPAQQQRAATVAVVVLCFRKHELQSSLLRKLTKVINSL